MFCISKLEFVLILLFVIDFYLFVAVYRILERIDKNKTKIDLVDDGINFFAKEIEKDIKKIKDKLKIK